MKKLIAMLLTAIIAIQNNLPFIQQEDKLYSYDDIWMLDTSDLKPDYRSQSRMQSQALAKNSCRTVNYTNNGKEVKYQTDPPYIAYWLEDGVTKSIGDISNTEKKYVFEASVYIIAPYDCTLITPLAPNADGHSMDLVTTLNGQQYRIRVAKMDRWYCDVLRDEENFRTSEGDIYWQHTYKEGSHDFKRGQVLGLAVEGETEVIVDYMSGGAVVDGECTLRKFFMQEPMSTN